MRVTTSKTTRARHKKVLQRAKGFKGTRSVRFSVAKEVLLQAMRYETIHRKNRRRDIKKLWITRISAFVRSQGMTYSRFMEGLKKANVAIDRKALSWLIINDPMVVNKYVTISREAISP